MPLTVPKIYSDDSTFVKFTKFLSIVGGPLVIIIPFCDLALDFDRTDTAIVSLGSMLLSTVLLLFSWIKNTIQSPYLIVLMTLMLGSFYFGYKNIWKKKTGLIQYWRVSNDILPTVREKVNNTQSLMLFYGANFFISSVDHRKDILKKLANGVSVHYLVYNPFSSYSEMVARDFKQTKDNYVEECKTGLRGLIQLQNDWIKLKPSALRPGELEIRMYNASPRMRAYIFDPTDQNSECFFIPYMHRTNSPDLPAFQFQNLKDGVFNDYFTSICYLWDSSVNINNLAKSTPELAALFN